MKLPTVDTGVEELDEKIKEYVSWEKDKEYVKHVLQLVSDKEIGKLRHLFLTRMSFGTAGLRGVMGPGFNQMNEVVIIQTGQGLARYLQECFPDIVDRGVVIGFDGRYNSHRFAKLTATIFLQQGIRVYLYPDVCPTPFVAYGVGLFKCVAGIMVTASHNPKEDNGYKVYWDNGAQIISPHDKKIQEHILQNLVPCKTSWDVSILKESDKLCDPLPDVTSTYYRKLKEGVPHPSINAASPLKFVYTAMHGVGTPFMRDAFSAAGFKDFIPVEEQKDPDPDFPTVKFPNPEEGKSALDLSIQTANANGSTIILANDPDADRLAVAEKVNNEWKVFTGNELGALLGWWALQVYHHRYPNKSLDDVYMLNSTVSSKILKTIAKAEGFKFEETLTGFKWMGNRAHELLQENKTVLFAFEEAIGFMCESFVLDKDGVSAGVRIAELAAFLQAQGKSLAQKLDEIFKQYGYHISENSYYICHKQEVIKKIFERLRNFSDAPCTYPKDLLQGKYNIVAVRDLTTGYDSSMPDNKAILPVSKSSQMITFTFDNGLVVTLRTSGTEPKIKYYSELCADPAQSDVGALYPVLHEMVSALVEEYLQPSINGLLPRTA